ncbi:acyl-CoA Delta-9 desaturase [Halyomorpha halys]|uniref:acyl-CoA Delta-9 desaturase n=1 Tax=Halyomorpha halys TaxID=286706 RepID=UPI0006D4CAFA|nr:acyl-CoA desaturase-like [Halyomorpha halys]XP_024217367.1 acyl-CoA desaturase-like [Halyomorpha halys]XP_024217368.1 acyl-CoA desaturase-like [Halyomorpha halys]
MENKCEDSEALEVLKQKKEPFVPSIFWPNVFGFALLHAGAIWAWYRFLSGNVMLATFIYAVVLGYYCGLCVTIGAHRLWAHRSFKAKLPLRLICLIGQTMSGQNCLWVWVRDHRQHHKYSDTDADPHNSTRGFFFSHIGWLMIQKHPEVIAKGRQMDMSDLEADPWIMFQKKHYKILYLIFAILIPVAIPCYFWNETFMNSFLVSYFARYVTQLNITWSVNSFAHIYGTRPYDKNISPVENIYVAAFGMGEGWHNYHHTFPWDCYAAELGRDYNFSGTLLDFLGRIGLAYDLKRATKEMTLNRVHMYGDGSHPAY